jgi:hypothetical protein
VHRADARCSLWYPQIQVTFKYYNPSTGQKIWKSLSVSKFETPAPAGSGRDKAASYDGRSCKGEQFSVLHSTLPDGSESYEITAHMDAEVQLGYTYTRPASCAGWKVGAGAEGGKSFFGANQASPDGFVVHRFWPRAHTSGHILLKGQALDARGTGMFVHAIQGMRPNLVASRWNFANFQSDALGGVSAISMEFTTTSDYGGEPGSAASSKAAASGAEASKRRETRTVTIGSVVVGERLVAVTAGTRGAAGSAPKHSNTAVEHLECVQDPDTGYSVPQAIRYVWDGALLAAPPSEKGDTAQRVQAELRVELGPPHPVAQSKGLVDKVDVLGEMPAVVKKVVSYMAGTKPFIYQVGQSWRPFDCPATDALACCRRCCPPSSSSRCPPTSPVRPPARTRLTARTSARRRSSASRLFAAAPCVRSASAALVYTTRFLSSLSPPEPLATLPSPIQSPLSDARCAIASRQ